jgi:hypothetical protein
MDILLLLLFASAGICLPSRCLIMGIHVRILLERLRNLLATLFGVPGIEFLPAGQRYWSLFTAAFLISSRKFNLLFLTYIFSIPRENLRVARFSQPRLRRFAMFWQTSLQVWEIATDLAEELSVDAILAWKWRQHSQQFNILHDVRLTT